MNMQYVKTSLFLLNHVFVAYTEKGVLFSKMCAFKTLFKCLQFKAIKMLLSCKQAAKMHKGFFSFD